MALVIDSPLSSVLLSCNDGGMSTEAAKGGEENSLFFHFFSSMYKPPASLLADDIVERSWVSCRILTEADLGRRLAQFLRFPLSVKLYVTMILDKFRLHRRVSGLPV